MRRKYFFPSEKTKRRRAIARGERELEEFTWVDVGNVLGRTLPIEVHSAAIDSESRRLNVTFTAHTPAEYINMKLKVDD